MNRYQTVRTVARDPAFPNEAVLRAMVRRGVCPGYFQGSRFYVDTVILRDQLDHCTSGNSREVSADDQQAE